MSKRAPSPAGQGEIDLLSDPGAPSVRYLISPRGVSVGPELAESWVRASESRGGTITVPGGLEVAHVLAGLFAVLNERFADLAVDVPKERLREAGVQAGEQVITTLRWSAVVGDRLDTSQVTALLGSSRQALHERVRRGKLLAFPGRGTSWFPAWQFDRTRRRVRPVVPKLLDVFRDDAGGVDPWLVAGWASTPQPDLDDQTPIAYIEAGGGETRLMAVAAEAAEALAH